MLNVPAYSLSSVSSQQQVRCHGEHYLFQARIAIKFNNIVQPKYPENIKYNTNGWCCPYVVVGNGRQYLKSRLRTYAY